MSRWCKNVYIILNVFLNYLIDLDKNVPLAIYSKKIDR